MFLLISATANVDKDIEVNFVATVPEILPESLILLSRDLSTEEQELVRALEKIGKIEEFKGLLLRTYLTNNDYDMH